jgi:hypothetical protein
MPEWVYCVSNNNSTGGVFDSMADAKKSVQMTWPKSLRVLRETESYCQYDCSDGEVTIVAVKYLSDVRSLKR